MKVRMKRTFSVSMLKTLFDEIFALLAESGKKPEIWIVVLLLASGFAIPAITVSNFAELLWNFVQNTWWLWIFFILFPISRGLLLHVRQEYFTRKVTWALLEISMPREVEKSPRAMEQALLVFHTLRSAPGNIYEKYWKGEVVLWSSLEMVSIGGEIHFYVRVPEKHRNNIEAALFSFYPNVEIRQVEDYVAGIPRDVDELMARNYDIWGGEFVLAKEEAYPIKTYTQFETMEETLQVDPIATTLELLSKIKPQEMMCFQVLIEPVSAGGWKDRAKPVLSKLQTPAVAEISVGEEKKTVPIIRSPGQTAILEAVEKNIAKPAFHTLLRVFFMSPKETFSEGYVRSATSGALNQYKTENLNAFKPNSLAATSLKKKVSMTHTVFGGKRLRARKNLFLYNFRNRQLPHESFVGKLLTSYFFRHNFSSKRFVMSAEGIATIFHPPAAFVQTGSIMQRIESRKSGPSAGLPIFGEESDLEKFT